MESKKNKQSLKIIKNRFIIIDSVIPLEEGTQFRIAAIIKFLLQLDNRYTKIKYKVILIIAGNNRNSKKVIILLLNQYKDQVTIIENIVKTITEN